MCQANAKKDIHLPGPRAEGTLIAQLVLGAVKSLSTTVLSLRDMTMEIPTAITGRF